MATTQPSTSTCLLDEIGSSITVLKMVKLVAFLWTLPAALLIVAGTRLAFDRSASPLAIAYVDMSRAAVGVLATFTLLVGGIWLVRSQRSLPAVSVLNNSPLPLAAHARFALLALVCLGTTRLVDGALSSAVLGSMAVVAGCIGGLVLPRWLLAIDRADRPSAGDETTETADTAPVPPFDLDRAPAALALLVAVIVFELSIGWSHSVALAAGPSVVSAGIAMIRGLTLSLFSLIVVVSSRP